MVYTGTHDNDTAEGWFASLDEHDRNFVREYMGCRIHRKEEIHWDLSGLHWEVVAKLAVIPVQDYLGYDTQRQNQRAVHLGRTGGGG